MDFICEFVPELGKPTVFEASEKKLKDLWKTMFDNMFTHGRNPYMIVQPTTTGIYILERIM